MKYDYPCEYDVWDSVDEADRKWREEHAADARRNKGDEKHEEAVRGQEGQGSVLRLDQQGKEGVKQVAQEEQKVVLKPRPEIFNSPEVEQEKVKRKPGRPRKYPKDVDAVIAKIVGKA